MKRLFAFLSFLLALGCSTKDAPAQSGCELTQWISSQQPNANATPERDAHLRDTVLGVSGNPTVQIPAGFTITQFASAGGARGVTLSPDGVIYLTARSGGGRIIALPDHNQNGKPDSTIVIASNLGSNIHGIGFINGQLYFSTDTRFARIDNTDNDRESEGITNIATLPEGGNHVTRTFVYDSVKKKVYIQVGSTCNVCEEDDQERATILEMNLDGSGRHIFARGLRNAVGLDIDPRTGALWANVNESDNMFGSGTAGTRDFPREPVFIVCAGAHYGWPYAYGYRIRNILLPHIDTSFFDAVSGPVAGLMAHSAPLGMHFLRMKSFPLRYHNALFQAYHGSWNRTPPAPPRVTVLWSDPNGQNAVLEDFLTGFQVNSSTRSGRPVSLTEGADGALYVTDDQQGAVYRIVYTGEKGRSIDLGLPTVAGSSFTPGQQVQINWNASGVDSFVVLFRLNDLAQPETLAVTTSRFITWTTPDLSSTTANIRVESTNGLTFAETGNFRLVSSGGVSSKPQTAFRLTPNPARDELHITLTGDDQLRQIEILDIVGRVVQTIKSSGSSQTLKVADLPVGTYLVRVTTQAGIHTEQVVISR